MQSRPQLIESVLAQHISYAKRIWVGMGNPHSYSLHSGDKKIWEIIWMLKGKFSHLEQAIKLINAVHPQEKHKLSV